MPVQRAQEIRAAKVTELRKARKAIAENTAEDATSRSDIEKPTTPLLHGVEIIVTKTELKLPHGKKDIRD